MLLLVQALQCHHKFFKGGVPCPLAQTIYCHMSTCGSSNYSRNGIRNSQAEIIVTMKTYWNRNILLQESNQLGNEFWGSVTHGIRYIYSVGPRFSDCFEYFGQEGNVRPGGVLCRK